MITRNILNYLGEVVGQMDFEDGTSEQVIASKLADYATPPPAPVIPDVTPRQIRQALIRMGFQLSMVTDAIDMLPSPSKELAHAEWEYSTMILRNNPLVGMLAQSQGWTTQQLDQLFTYAHTL